MGKNEKGKTETLKVEKKLTAIDKVAAALDGGGDVLIRTAPLRLIAEAVLELAGKKKKG